MTWHNKPKKERKNYSKDSEEPLSEPRINTISEDRKIFGPISPNQQWLSSCYRIDACRMQRWVRSFPCRFSSSQERGSELIAELDPQQQTSAAAALRKKPARSSGGGVGGKQTPRRAARNAGGPGPVVRNRGEVNRTRRSGLKRRMREE